MVVMKYSSFIIIKMVWLLLITNHQFMAGDRTGCIEEEKKVLLELKVWLGSRMNHFNDDVIPGIMSNFLPSWVDDDGGNCCDGWEGITCDSLTGHVLKLDLNYIYDIHYFYRNNKNFNSTWTSTGFERLSALKQLENLHIKYMELDTSFLPSLITIRSLKVLDLKGNNLFKNNFSSQDCEAFLGLRKLEELSLGDNYMSKSINISCLASLPSLKSLSLDCQPRIYPYIGDSFFLTKGLERLQQLKVLSISYCDLTTKDVQSLSKMGEIRNLDLAYNALTKDVLVELDTVFPSLQFLNLSYNYDLEGSLPNEDLIGFHHLEILDLTSCGLAGTIPAQSLCKMNKLQVLDLHWNHFKGDIPTCLNELSFLRRLDLSYNKMSGNLSSSMFRDLNSLEYIGLRDNSFQGIFSLSTFANFSKLEEVMISNNDKLVIETEELAEWVPKFQLKTLEMSNCSLKKIPKFLFFQKDLSWLDLSHNRLGGSFPNWLLVNNTRLEYLYLEDNNFGGSFSLPQTKSEIIELDISNNQLKGHIPANIDQLLPLLTQFNISFNAFDGGIPRSLGNMSTLRTLVMSNNNLVGEVPIEIISISSLHVLDLSSNSLGGFSSTFNLSKENSLDVIDISHNKMLGHIPLPTTGNLVLVMRHNYYSGLFPCELYMAYFLDISYNSFTGALPDACSGFKNSLIHLNLHGNKFTGLVPQTILSSPFLRTLDIGNNFFSGRIPNFIHDQSRLQVLSARGNGLSGAIPDELCKLQMLNLLDLSHNSFSGSIPSCFGTNISFGKNAYVESNFYAPKLYYNKFDYKADVVISIKHRIDSYTGNLLSLMSGLDLSSNNLEGEIPDALGNLSSIRALNLSHNWLSGPIPQTFSNLMQIESLDLSHNNLSGEIPWKLVNLNFLEVFSVAYNNLLGRLPERKGQFGTFEENSYAGNPYLCGLPLKKDCKVEVKDGDVDGDNDEHDHEEWYDIDREGFFASFMASYIVYILGFITVLWINRGWRSIWFNFIEKLLFSSYYFLSDTLYKSFRVRI